MNILGCTFNGSVVLGGFLVVVVLLLLSGLVASICRACECADIFKEQDHCFDYEFDED